MKEIENYQMKSKNSFLFTSEKTTQNSFLPFEDVFLSNEKLTMQAEDLPTNTVSQHCP